MRCWVLFHDWSKWSEMEQTTFRNALGDRSVGMVQHHTCLKCGKTKWRRV